MSTVAKAFSAAALHYDAQAGQQRAVLYELVRRASPYIGVGAGAGARVLDAGCGTGRLARYVAEQALGWNVLATDLAEGMCRKAALYAPCFAARMETLPVKPASLDAVFSSLAMQWSDDIDQTFIQIAAALRPGGIAAISSFTAGTLQELAHAFAAVDDYTHIRAFHPLEAYVRAAQAAGLRIRHRAGVTLTREDDSLRDLLSYLKAIGANRLSGGGRQRRKGLLSPRQFRLLETHYPKQRKGLVSSWQVGYLVAAKPM